MLLLVPDSFGATRARQLREDNDCHNPKGSSAGGEFCSRGLTTAERDQLKAWRLHAGAEMTDEQREGLRPLLNRTLPGGDLAHLRPKTGTVLYRGDDAKRPPSGVASFSHDKAYTSLFGDTVWELKVWDETKALDLHGLFPGVDEGEVLVLLDARTRTRVKKAH